MPIEIFSLDSATNEKFSIIMGIFTPAGKRFVLRVGYKESCLIKLLMSCI